MKRQMNNLKEHIGSFLTVLLGVVAFGFVTVKILRIAFNTDYVQIFDLILGFFFGLITLLFLVFLFYFFRGEDIDTVLCNIWMIMGKWKFFDYSGAFLAVVCFIISINFYRNKDVQNDFVAITITQTNDSEIQGSRESHKNIIIVSKEYPKFLFQIYRDSFKYTDSDSYINNVKPGDTLTLMITKESYDKKIAKTKPLSFTDKTVNYRIIGICGLKYGTFELLSTKDYLYARKKYSEFSAIFFAAIGIYFLYMLAKIILSGD